jgi:hypothetical protein
MTKQEEILNKYIGLYFSSHHDKSQWNGEGEHGGAEWHTNKAIAADIYKAMDEFAKQQAIDFALNYAKSVHTDTYVKPTAAELERMSFRYDKFIEQQSK